VWRVVHVALSEEGCVRCGGDLEQLDDGLELLPLAGRERRFSIPNPAAASALDAPRAVASS
jgi:hypothetical protein